MFQFPGFASPPMYSVTIPLRVGFPIRKFTDQSLFAAPRDLSQRTTSFIASQRQGIHRTPLSHLIALIVDARHGRRRPDVFDRREKDQFLRDLSDRRRLSLRICVDALPIAGGARTNLLFTMSGTARGHARRSEETRENFTRGNAFSAVPAHAGAKVWWSQTGSNRRPPACKAGALPTELWPRVGLRSGRHAGEWWARDDLNVRPHAYQACALTT